MLKIAVILFLTVSLLTANYSPPVAPVFAQTTNKQALDDYFFQLEIYQDSHSDFVIARDSYKQFGTLASKTEAFNKTKEYLTQVTTLLISYDNAIITILANNNGLTNEQKDPYVLKVKDHKTNFGNIQIRINQIKRLEDFNQIAGDIETEKQIHDENGKVAVELSKIGYINSNILSLNQYIGLIDVKISAAKRSGKNVSYFEIGPQEIRKRLTSSNELVAKSLEIIASTDRTASGKVALADQNLSEAQKQLLEATSFFKEIIRNLI